MFESAKLKLQWADQHVRNFEAVATAYINERPHRPVFKGNRQDGDVFRVWIEIIVDRDLPTDLALILGDAIHNFRCAIDHLAWELIGMDGGTQNRHTKFPFGKTRIDFEAAARGMITPRQSTKNFLVDLAAYPSGRGEVFYAIHSLDNADKHRVLTPILSFSCLSGITLIDLATKKRIAADPIYIGPVGPNSEASFVIPAGHGVDANYRIYPTPDIFCPEVDVFPNEPVVYALARISQDVERLIGAFETFVTNRVP